MTSNKIDTIVKHGMNEIAGMEDYEDNLRLRAVKLSQNKKAYQLTKVKILTDDDIERMAMERKTRTYLESRLPKLEKKFMFDCHTTSTAIRGLRDSVALHTDKKSVKTSNYQPADFGTSDFEKLHKITVQKGQNKAPSFRSFRTISKSINRFRKLKS